MSDTVHDCWLPPPFAFFPFISPPVRFRVPSLSVSALLKRNAVIWATFDLHRELNNEKLEHKEIQDSPVSVTTPVEVVRI